MIEIIKTFFGNSLSAVEAFCGAVSLGSIITLIGSIFFIVYKGKKFDKATTQINKEVNEKIDAFKQKHEEEIKEFEEKTKKNIDNLCNMFLIEATKQGVDLEKFNAIVDLYKKTISYEMLDTDKLQEEKEKEIETEQTKQEQVNQNLNNIDKTLSDLV